METTIVTLKLPNDIVDLIRRYCRKIIVNDVTGNTTSNVVNKATVIPTYDDVVEEVRKTNSNINPQRFFNYYSERNWLDKKGNPFDWKQMLSTWGTYNIEKKQPQSKTVTNEERNAAYVQAVKDFMAAEGKAS